MKRLWLRMFKKGEVGQSIIILALGFIGLLAVVGITTDVSILFARYAQLRRAVDAAAIAAAAQMREDRSIATVNLTARQYIEFHGINPRDVQVDTCENLRIDTDGDGDADINSTDEEVCPPDDTRKLVRVTAQVESETVFLRLVGWRNITLQASAISETAVLDVVIVLDVSESMLDETTYVDWATVGQGVAFVPPRIDLSSSSWPETGYPGSNFLQETVLYKMSNVSGVGFLPTVPVSGRVYIDYTSGAPISHPLGNFYGNNPQFWWEDWFWQGHLLSVTQEEVNQRLWYSSYDGAADPDFNDPKNRYYEVKSFIPYDVQAAIAAGEVPGTQTPPREACRVRFFPYSYQLRVSPYDQEVYNRYNSSWVWPQTAGERRWFGFVPTYNFYGCCNDPGNGEVDENGLITGVTATAPDGDFSDLVCQPFKSARDATRQFLDRIDFERGDRVAFVTFDISAHLIDPDGDGPINPMISRFTNETTGVTYNARDIARQVLNTSIGVRAEPNFYIWDDAGGGIFKSPAMDVGGWTRDDPNTPAVDAIPAYSQMLDENGNPIPIDYDATGSSDDWGQDPHGYSSYPVYNNCFLQNSTMKFPNTRYANRNTTARNGEPAMSNYLIPNPYTDPYWVGKNLAATLTAENVSLSGVSYERNAACGGGNVGAALREANNALIDPNTSRREGTVWIIIFLGDGAAGRSDPVRVNGRLPNPPRPYEAISETYQFNWTTGTASGFNQYGTPGEYGFYGVCPPGGQQVADYEGVDREQLGELVLLDYPTNEPTFPYCSDEKPETRHFCMPSIQAVIGGDSTVGYPNYEAGFGPQALDITGAALLNDGDPMTNPTEQNYYDIDIGRYGQEPNCSNLYDVDDYARDWADFVAGVGELGSNPNLTGSDDAVLPTIFTIGFGLTFDNGGSNSDDMCARNMEDCLGEELLRYIADAGDNFRIDNDHQQDYRYDLTLGTPDNDPDFGGYGPKDPCQAQDVDYVPGDMNTIKPFPRGESCGNYYNAPGPAELQQVFNDIASRMFTRLAG